MAIPDWLPRVAWQLWLILVHLMAFNGVLALFVLIAHARKREAEESTTPP